MLTSGTRLGPYEIVGHLGAGGMGEVYRARDTRLDRTVAIKVLPSHLSSDPDLKQRFEREARAISALNHPNICTLHDVGHQDGIDFLVMEFIEGETLADRLNRGPVPLEQLLKIGMEIAEGLDKAHRAGIVHRDLKPGNIMLTKSGAKLLDFGLAKPSSLAGAVKAAGDATMATLASPASPITARGSVMGTFQYMAPEQIEGREADARSDIFAFGAVLYEMATGRRAFQGKSQISIASAILERDPKPITTLQPASPPVLEHIVKTCLAKDPEERYQTAHDVKLELRWVLERGSVPPAATWPLQVPGLAAWRSWAAMALLLAIGLAAGLVLRGRGSDAGAGRLTRFSVAVGDRHELGVDISEAVALSPDGRRLAYIATESGVPRLYLHSLDQFESTPVPESEGASFPFFSADGRWIGFFSQGKIQKAPVTGGAPIGICAVSTFIGGAWTRNDVIFFAMPGKGLARVRASGGVPEPITIPGAERYIPTLPSLVPGDQWLLFTDFSTPVQRVMAWRIGASDLRLLVDNAGGSYVTDGQLVYYSAGSIWAVPFDAKTVSITGAPQTIAQGTDAHNFIPQFSAAAGTLAYAAGLAESGKLLFWVDRSGSAQKIEVPTEDFVDPAVSPDGKRFVVAIRRVGEQLLAVYDLERGVFMRMSAGGGRHASPVWSPDGKSLIYDGVGPAQKAGIYQVAADGSTAPFLIHELSSNGHVTSISSQNRAVVMLNDPATGVDLWLLNLTEHHPELQSFRRTPAAERQGSFSHDGMWLAYASNESGRSEIYVEPVAGHAGRWQISTDGGEQPRWSPTGREIFYRNGTRMMSVAVETQPRFVAAKPLQLFDVRFDRGGAVPGYDVTPDGKRFLMIQPVQPNPTEVRVVLNWREELPKAAPLRP